MAGLPLSFETAVYAGDIFVRPEHARRMSTFRLRNLKVA